MHCDHALEQISAALDGELTAREREELDDHLAGCPSCAALFDELAGQSRLLRDLDCEMPDDLTDRILSQLPAPKPAPEKAGWVLPWRRWGALAACLVLAAWAGLSLPGVSADSESGPMAAAYSLRDAAPSCAPEDEDTPLPVPTEESFEEKSAAPNQLSPQSEAADLDVQYLRTTWADSSEPLTAQYLNTRTELTGYLAQYPEDAATLTLATECYDDAYFETAALLAVPLEEPSSSITPSVAEVSAVESGYEVIIRRETPDVVTDDMSSWLILIETDASAEAANDISAATASAASGPVPDVVVTVLVED